MRLSFTLMAAFLLALAATFWWTGERAGAPAPQQASPGRGVALEPPPLPAEAPRSDSASIPEQPVSRDVESLPPPAPAPVAEHVALADPGDFVPDPGPVGEAVRLPDVASRPGVASESAPGSQAAEGPVVYVDPGRSGGFVKRLLRIYELVRE